MKLDPLVSSLSLYDIAATHGVEDGSKGGQSVGLWLRSYLVLLSIVIVVY